MNLALITITCRPEPRFRDVAEAITGNLLACGQRAPEFVWIVVDELGGNSRRRDELKDAVAGRFAFHQIPPKPSDVRGPNRKTPEDLPDQNSARNSGLALAMALHADYVVYLDDCTIPTQSLFQVAFLAAEKRVCLRVPIIFKTDIAIPQGGKVSFGESGGMHFVPCKATTAAGGCFGMPITALEEIAGFDEIYAGAMGKQDLDAFIRAERVDWKWMTSKRCAAIQLSKTHDKASVSRNDEALSGRASLKPWNDLLRDKTRFLPVKGCDLDGLVRVAKEFLDAQNEKRPAPVLPLPPPPDIIASGTQVVPRVPAPEPQRPEPMVVKRRRSSDDEPTGVGGPKGAA